VPEIQSRQVEPFHFIMVKAFFLSFPNHVVTRNQETGFDSSWKYVRRGDEIIFFFIFKFLNLKKKRFNVSLLYFFRYRSLGRILVLFKGRYFLNPPVRRPSKCRSEVFGKASFKGRSKMSRRFRS